MFRNLLEKGFKIMGISLDVGFGMHKLLDL